MSATKFKVGSMMLDAFLTPEEIRAALPDRQPTKEEFDDLVSRHSRRLAYFGEMAGRATAQAETAKLRVEILEGRISGELRNKAIESGEKVVEKRIETEVLLDQRMKEARVAQIKAREIEATVSAAYWALKSQDKQMDRWAMSLADDTRRDKRITEADLETARVRERASQFRSAQSSDS